MTEQDAIKAAKVLKDFCMSRRMCKNGKYDICPFLDERENISCVLSVTLPGDWQLREAQHDD